MKADNYADGQPPTVDESLFAALPAHVDDWPKGTLLWLFAQDLWKGLR